MFTSDLISHVHNNDVRIVRFVLGQKLMCLKSSTKDRKKGCAYKSGCVYKPDSTVW